MDVSGTWEITVSTVMGDQSGTLTLEQSGADLTGEFEGDMGSVALEHGEVSGQNIEFVLLLPVTDPPMELIFEGTVSGNKMTGTIDLGEMGTADWTATKPNQF